MTSDPRPAPTPNATVNQRPANYYAAYARDRVVNAQQAVDRHTTSAYNGCCLGCGRPGPCVELAAAEATLARYHRLPFRRPGATLLDQTLLDPARTTDNDRARFTWWRRPA
ncbi:hypothetical protein [Micromonospora sp. LOL_015]|uniref:hypothetical protein n=1 Tax=Micromonospora sp. LOL_015 TaxID=3345416 RepID=UPI003A8B31DE